MKAKQLTKEKGKTMNPLTQFKKIRILPLLIAPALIVGAALTAVPALATPSTGGVTTEILSYCNFGVLNILTKTDINPSVATHFWMLGIESKGATDVYVVRVTFPPGGSTGWHKHPGPSLITVVSGTLTAYDSNCTPHVYNAGECFIDKGDHVHLVRNEGTVPAVDIATQLVPAGFPRRTEADNPGCVGIN
ncbi:MAG TPA: cupin domain-containing protein [Chthoniobacterales bacterium]|nr:cupin domain-containing protein [Chthoniobacterales bacterium]